MPSRPRRRPPPEPPPSGKRRWKLGRRQEEADVRSSNGRLPATLADEQERLIIEALADLRNRDVREVMTPRMDVVILKIPVHVEDVARAVRESGHSSFPVVHDDLDDLVGVLFVTDLFRTRHPSSQEPLPSLSPIDISRRVRPAHVVPESRGILDTLAEMRAQRKAFAVVVDEYGGIAGVLTVKDLLEPLVGDLHDEFDQDEGEIVRVDASRWLIDGRTSPDDVRERLGIDVPEGEYVTLGGYPLRRLRSHPRGGGGHLHGRMGPASLRDGQAPGRQGLGAALVAAPGRQRQRGREPSPRGRAATRPGLPSRRPSATAGKLAAPGSTGCGAVWLARSRSGRRGPRFKSGQPDQ